MINAMMDNEVLPYSFNILHMLAHENNEPCLKKALEDGCRYQRDALEISPIKYGIVRNSRECVATLLDFITENDNFVGLMTEDEIVELIKFSPDTLGKFFENAISVATKNVPKFGELASDEAIYFTLEDKNIKKDDVEKYLIKNEKKPSEIPILVRYLEFKYNFRLGSKSSLRFHNALFDCRCDEVFETEAIQRFIDFKWPIIQKAALRRVYIFFIGMLSIYLHSCYPRQVIYLILHFIICIQVAIYWKGLPEGTKAADFFGNVQHLLEFLVVFLSIIYIPWQIIDPSNTFNNCLLVFINLLGWFLGLMYLRCIDSLRVLIHVFIEVLFGIKDFLIVCILFIFTFGTTTIIAKEVGRRNNLIMNLDNPENVPEEGSKLDFT